MAVPRAKKPKPQKKNTEELMAAVQELHKAIMYLYLADVKKYTQKDIEDMNLSFARTILAISNGGITFDTILDKLEEHGVNLEEVGKKTDKFIDEHWNEWRA